MSGQTETLKLSSTGPAVEITAHDRAVVTAKNLGPDTVYYDDARTVSSVSNDGTLAAGATATFSATRWFKSAGRSRLWVETPDRLDQLEDDMDALELIGSDIALKSRLAINVEDFASYVSGSDWTPAIHAACAELPTVSTGRGGDIQFLPGKVYQCDTQLDVHQTYGVRFVSGGGVSNSSRTMGILTWTGTGAGSFIDARSTYGFTLKNMWVEYTSPLYTGDLIDYSHGPGAYDSTWGLIDNCVLTSGAYTTRATARCMVKWQHAIFCKIKDSQVQGAQYGVRCREDLGGGNVAYSNGHVIDNVTFDHITGAAIMNAGEVLTIIAPGAEGTGGGNNLVHLYSDDISDGIGSVCYGLSFRGTWAGDAVSITNWIETNHTTVRGFEFDGLLSGGTKGIVFGKGGSGIHIRGAFGSMTNAVDLGSSATGIVSGAKIAISAQGVTGAPILNTSGHRDIDTTGTSARNGENQGEHVWSISGHMGTDAARGVAPTIAVQVGQAGAGATASISGNDTAGTITINTGTGATTGLLANVTFAVAYDANWQGSNNRPKVVLTPRTADAAAAHVYTGGNGKDIFTMNAGAVPASSSTLTYDYFVIQ